MHIKLVILLISLSVFLKTAYSAVIGIDFGQEFFKICLISPGKSFAIVENMQSKRKTHTAVPFLIFYNLNKIDFLKNLKN